MYFSQSENIPCLGRSYLSLRGRIYLCLIYLCQLGADEDGTKHARLTVMWKLRISSLIKLTRSIEILVIYLGIRPLVSHTLKASILLSQRIGTLLRLLNLSGGQVLGDEGWTANSQVLVRSWLHGVAVPTRLQWCWFAYSLLFCLQCSALLHTCLQIVSIGVLCWKLWCTYTITWFCKDY